MGGSKHMFVGTLISHYFLVAHDAHQGAAFTVFCGAILLGALAMGNWYFTKKVNAGTGQ